MRVLITGSAGFVGSHVSKAFIEKGHSVVGLERLSFSGNQNRSKGGALGTPEKPESKGGALGTPEKPESKGGALGGDPRNNFSEIGGGASVGYTPVNHDLRNPINELLKKQIGPIDWIIHIAASSHVDRSIDDPMSFVLDNVVGTCNILEYARAIKPKRFVYFSTDEVFGPCFGDPFKEDSPYNSTNPYSASKAGGEELAVAYRNTYKLPIVVTHTMNIFGNTQHPEKFIPMCVSKIKNGQTVFIHSDPTKTVSGSRFYIHVDDVGSALLFIMGLIDDTHEKCPKYNIVGSEEITNYNLAKMIGDILEKPLNYEFVDFHSARPGHDLRYALDGSKLRDLGWTPKPLKEKLKEVILWSGNDKWS